MPSAAARRGPRALSGDWPAEWLPCLHRGAAIGSVSVSHANGRERFDLPIHACAVHGRCTAARAAPQSPADRRVFCGQCPDHKAEPLPFTGPVRRNFLMHLWPLAGNGVWQWHINDMILPRIAQFNGRRIVSVVTDDNTDSVETVRAAFGGEAEVIDSGGNDPGLREVKSFDALFGPLESTDLNEITFYAQGKGVRYPQSESVRRWVEMMYTLLDWPIEETLTTHAVAGMFKRPGYSKADWHYAGSFFWFRNQALYSRNWRNIERGWFGMETYPGVMFASRDAASVFPEHDDGRSLYLEAAMDYHHDLQIEKRKWNRLSLAS